MADSMVCPYCGHYTVPYGGEPVCGEDYCPKNDYADDSLDYEHGEESDDDD